MGILRISINFIASNEVRGSGREYQTARAQELWRGATPRLRSGEGGGGAAAERSYPASVVRGGSREEIPHAPKPQGRGDGWEELTHAPTPEARAGGQDEQPHAGGQEQWPGGPTPRSRSCGYAGAGGPREAIPR